jgi:Ca2+-binding EF-hand superfamily protein
MNDTKRGSIPAWRMATLLSLALGAPAFAEDPGAKFKAMDTNNDGMVSAAEHAAAVTSMFGEMDADGDGKVTAAEMDARHAMMKPAKAKEPMTSNDAAMDHGAMHREMSSAEKIAKMDTDGDGMLSSAEHDAGAKTMFSEMDTDGNGSLSRQELAAGHATMMKHDKTGKTPPKSP